MSVKQRVLELAQGKRRFLSDKELAERDFEGFFQWLRERGVESPYYYYPKEAWGLWRFQRDYNEYHQGLQAKAQADQQRANLIQALKDPTTSKGVVLAAIMLWPKDQQEDLVAVLSPPPLLDEPPADVQADADLAGVPAP